MAFSEDAFEDDRGANPLIATSIEQVARIQCFGGRVTLVLFFVNIPRIVCGCGGFIFPEYQVEHILAVVHAEFFIDVRDVGFHGAE